MRGHATALILMLCAVDLFGTSPLGLSQAAPLVRPLYAEQVGTLDASYAKEGARVLARVREDWGDGSCHLEPQSVIEGRVVRVVRRSKTEKISTMEVSFERAGCNQVELAAYRLTLVAIIGPPGDGDSYANFASMEAAPLASYTGLNNAGQNLTLPGNSPSMLRSLSGGSQRKGYAPLNESGRKLPSQIASGQVIDVPKTTLSVGTGVGGATVITAVRKDVRLEPKTMLMLVPSAWLEKARAQEESEVRAEVARTEAMRNKPAVQLTATKPVAEFQDQTEICVDTCSVLGAIESREVAASKVVAKLPIREFGYSPHDRRRALSFDHETALIYLDEHHLLCAFDPHLLRARADDDGDSIRSVRAVMIDPVAHRIGRVVEWKVRGADSYLWRAGPGQVLVHMGRELRMFDRDLKVVKVIPVSGRVAWVVASPSNDHVTVAVVKERASGALARELEEAGEKKVEENLEVRVYDGKLELISESVRDGASSLPVLLDKGELRVSRVKAGQWAITEYGWDRTVHELANVKTACRPELSSPDHGLIFVTGCSGIIGVTWYRMLRLDGHTLLKGKSPSDEVGQSAEGAAGGTFGVKVMKANGPAPLNEDFKRSDVKREEIGIYRSSDGARISSVVTDDFILAQSSFAISPGGEQIAVAGKDSISFYSLKTK